MISAPRHRQVPALVEAAQVAIAAGTASEMGRADLEPVLVDLVVTWWPPSMVAVCSPRLAAARATGRLLDWLQAQPGMSWQQRWDASPAAAGGWDWLRQAGFESPSKLTDARYATSALIVVEAVRPSLEWLLSTRHMRLWGDYARYHDRDLFEQLRGLLEATGDGKTISRVYSDLCRLCIVTGKKLTELDRQDFLSARAHMIGSGRASRTLNAAWFYARKLGLLADEPFEMPVYGGQLTPQQLVDRYRLRSKVARAAFIEYLTERSTDLDYSTLDGRARHLARDFWANVEIDNPDIDTLVLTRQQATVWRERIKTLPDGRQRSEWVNVMGAVRAFYQDVAEWAQDDPARWIAWVAPCPIPNRASQETYRERRRHNDKMKDRTRLLTPLLPQLVAHVTSEQRRTQALLAAASMVERGDSFEFDGQLWRRPAMRGNTWHRLKTNVVALDPTGVKVDVTALEDRAFWTWATIEVLRLSGIRAEELMELTHLSIQSFLKPDGSLVPILQVAPSKTDRERVLPVAPELAHVLARIVARHTGGDRSCAVPLAMRYDDHERVFSAPMPFLFQRTWISGRNQTFTSGGIRGWLTQAANQARIRDVTGQPVTFTPHDFRRIWMTDMLRQGFPVHLVAEMAGHRDLNTTNGYNAIYPVDVIDRYEKFIRDRRALRPSQEYRPATAEEVQAFAEHFERRRVELGECVRPYATKCVHEHACIRCDFLTVEPAAAPRLDQIRINLGSRLEEAQRQHWLGDVEQLRVTIDHLRDKQQHLTRRAGDVDLDTQHLPALEIRTLEPVGTMGE